MSSENDNEASEAADTVGEVRGVVGPGGKILKKSTSMYLNVRLPHKPGRPSICEGAGELEHNKFTLYGDENYVPTDRVQNLINAVHDPKHRTHKIFCQMDVLKTRGEEYEWRETARWVKYEEKMEEGGKRWSKPHVASLSMHYLVELRRFLMESVLHLDVEAYSISQVAEKFLDEWIRHHTLDPLLRQHVRNVLLKHHRHGERGDDKQKKKLKRGLSQNSFSNLKEVSSQASLQSSYSSQSLDSMDSDAANVKKQNERFLRKIPRGAEVANIMIGGVEDLTTPLCGFMRLNDSRCFGDLTEVNLPTRFIFFLLGPEKMIDTFQECGRCIATMMVDDIFREVAYKCRNKDDMVAGVDEFLEQVTVLPPGEWDPKIRIEPPEKVPDQNFRKTPSSPDFFGNLEKEGGTKKKGRDDDGDEEGHADPSLVMTFTPFVGLIQDIRRKVPFYWSDIKDVVHVQCIASFIYIFLATLTPNVTFGGMLGKETDQYMGVMECIFAAAVTGVVFALFSGQPLNILGSTGPMLVLEKIIYQICKDNHWDFLPLRCWVGIWTAGMLLIVVMFNLSALVRYITRFTEESFACLIALIFIYEAFVKLGEIARDDAPVTLHPNGSFIPRVCSCKLPVNDTVDQAMNSSMIHSVNTITDNVTTTLSSLASSNMTDPNEVLKNVTKVELTKEECATMLGQWHCTGPVPDAFMFSLILFVGTFAVSIFCITFKTWPCFPTAVRQFINDFGVLIAIILMVIIDYILGLPTPKLTVPGEFKPTRPDRGWIVNPISDKNPWWLALAAGLPAIIATILVFMDQQITAVIVNRKENKLKKGKGYHLDLMIIVILVLANSFLGLPWYVAATVSAIAHIQSLRKESECTAPGEKPAFLGVREQRVTALLVGVLSGLAVLITNVLKVIPMPVLYGVFFYMGFSALRGMQFIDRVLLFFMPVKYQPDHQYLRHVPLWRVHMFTFIQIVCLAGLWAVKSIKSISIVFPLLVVATGVVRKVMDCVFTQEELKYLDDILPAKTKKKEKIEDEKMSEIEDNHGTFKHINGNAYDNTSLTPGEKKPAFYFSEENDIMKRKGNGGYQNNAFDTKL